MRAYARKLGHRALIDRPASVSRAALITIAVLLLMGVFAGGGTGELGQQPDCQQLALDRRWRTDVYKVSIYDDDWTVACRQ